MVEHNYLMINNMNENILYSWLFHFNYHTQLWYAFHREDHSAYWNGGKTKYPVIKSKNISVLMEILQKTNGENKLIENI